MIRFAKLVALICIVLAPFAFVVAMNRWFDSALDVQTEWQVRQALTINSSATTPAELPESGWRAISLPNRFLDDRSQPSGVWYRFEIDIAASKEESWAIYLQRPAGNYLGFVNGGSIEESEPMTLHARSVSLFFEIPRVLIHRGHNVVDLRCVGGRPHCLVDKILIGPSHALAPKFQSAFFFEVTIKQITLVCMLTMSLMMAALFRARSRDSIFGWYALALLFWAMHIWIDVAPLSFFRSAYLRECFLAIALEGNLVCTIFFVNRFIGVFDRKLERMLFVWAVLGAGLPVVSFVLFKYSMFWFYEFVLFPPLILMSWFQTWRLARISWQPTNTEAKVLAAVGWLLMVVGLRDDWVQIGWADGRIFYYPYTVGMVLLAFGFILLRHFMTAVEFAEKARDELAVRVVEKTTELERNLLRVKDLQHEQALSTERERIMRDMHDGVGGQLVQALSIATSRPELRPLEEPLRACLEELRLIIDSIEPTNGDLASVLGTLRTRMSRRLIAAGVEVHWQMEDIPLLTDFGPQRVFHVTHIVREAIANALKHSNAKAITVRAGFASRIDHASAAIAIEIIDDGAGLLDASGDGRGLSNMRRRADDLFAKLSIESQSTGTTVRLELPLIEASSKPDKISQAPKEGD